MKILKTVKIGFRNYEIKFVEDRRDREGILLDGQIDSLNRIIYLDQDLPDEEKEIAFLHEVIHGIFHNSCHSDWEYNEDLVECIAEGFFQLIKDNPKLFK